ncbi:hypothetical protein LTS15_010051 [Exophiala xenobiotica]|nr:hypothetical protein LTS15_010051 [Exophiala xenobiotica]
MSNHAGEQIQKVDQQPRPHPDQGTYLQYRQGPSVNGRATSHFDTTLAPTHDDIPTTRYAAHNHDDVTSGDGRE